MLDCFEWGGQVVLLNLTCIVSTDCGAGQAGLLCHFEQSWRSQEPAQLQIRQGLNTIFGFGVSYIGE
jgi:hypothetical protein